MKIGLLVIVLLMNSVVPSLAAEVKPNDKVILTVNAIVNASAKRPGRDNVGDTNDEFICELTETVEYKIVSNTGVGRIGLEMISHKNRMTVNGKGSSSVHAEGLKDNRDDWTYSIAPESFSPQAFIVRIASEPPYKVEIDVSDFFKSTGTASGTSQNFVRYEGENFDIPVYETTLIDKVKMYADTADHWVFENPEEFLRPINELTALQKKLQATYSPRKDGGFFTSGSASHSYKKTDETETTYDGSINVSWSVQCGDTPETEVSVETESYYTAWLPEGNLENMDSPGNNLIVRIKAYQKGDPSTPHKAHLKMMLADVSKNQGVCMNWPRVSIEGREGLRFRKEDFTGGDSLKFVDTSQLATLSAVEQVEFLVHAYDFGAWGTLQVTAEDDGGRQVKVKVREKDTSDLNIPLDENHNKIADFWEEEKDVKGVDASSDLDQSQGNLNHGDGFTLFEEYRGLVVQGEHQRLNPKKKELFVVNNSGSDVDAGIALFEAAADLKIVKGLQDEFDLSRVVNFHKNTVSRGGDQHGLLIEFGETLGGTGLTQPVKSDATYTPSPRAVQQINFAKDFNAFGPAAAAKDVAHELGHACGLRHHGEAGTVRLDSSVYDSKGNVALRPGDTTWTLYDARGSVVTERPYKLSGKVTFSQGSPAGGDVGCVMCYDSVFSFAYQAGAGGKQLASKPDVAPGTGLCTSTAGTVYNDKDHVPWPLFGDAQSGRGNCKSKVKIKDW